jgi:preprotein translocase subunit SecF
MYQLKGFHIPFVEKRWYFVAFSAITVAISLYLIFTRGLNFGTDFRGGTNLQYKFSSAASESEVRRIVGGLGIGGFSVQKVGRPDENRILIKMEQLGESQAFVDGITNALKSGTGQSEVLLERNESVGPKAGADLRKKAQLAIIVSWLLMLIYIGYRFDFAFAPGGIIALVHDIVLALGGFALTGREVSLTVVAALLTIVGYSINDTIVVYDRVRENLSKGLKLSFREVVNLSLNETLSRTIITSFTVFIVVTLMYFFGEGEFQNFGFAMMIGVITGVYSTFSVACPVYIALHENVPQLRKVESKAA